MFVKEQIGNNASCLFVDQGKDVVRDPGDIANMEVFPIQNGAFSDNKSDWSVITKLFERIRVVLTMFFFMRSLNESIKPSGEADIEFPVDAIAQRAQVCAMDLQARRIKMSCYVTIGGEKDVDYMQLIDENYLWIGESESKFIVLAGKLQRALEEWHRGSRTPDLTVQYIFQHLMGRLSGVFYDSDRDSDSDDERRGVRKCLNSCVDNAMQYDISDWQSITFNVTMCQCIQICVALVHVNMGQALFNALGVLHSALPQLRKGTDFSGWLGSNGLEQLNRHVSRLMPIIQLVSEEVCHIKRIVTACHVLLDSDIQKRRGDVIHVLESFQQILTIMHEYVSCLENLQKENHIVVPLCAAVNYIVNDVDHEKGVRAFQEALKEFEVLVKDRLITEHEEGASHGFQLCVIPVVPSPLFTPDEVQWPLFEPERRSIPIS